MKGTRNISFLLIVIGLMLPSCVITSGTSGEPTAIQAKPESTFTVIPPTEPSWTYLSTSAGKLRVVNAIASSAFPPGCEGGTCEMTLSGPGQIVTIWLEAENGQPLEKLFQACDSAQLVSMRGSKYTCFSGGEVNMKGFIAFIVSENDTSYILRWGNNPDVQIDL